MRKRETIVASQQYGAPGARNCPERERETYWISRRLRSILQPVQAKEGNKIEECIGLIEILTALRSGYIHNRHNRDYDIYAYYKECVYICWI